MLIQKYSYKVPCTLEPCDPSGKRPCIQYQCVGVDLKDGQSCTPDPNCPDEIMLECKQENGETKCVQYICKEKAKKLAVCEDPSEDSFFKSFEVRNNSYSQLSLLRSSSGIIKWWWNIRWCYRNVQQRVRTRRVIMKKEDRICSTKSRNVIRYA
jgi:hypothetical protein